jgi:hypothetical protein
MKMRRCDPAAHFEIAIRGEEVFIENVIHRSCGPGPSSSPHFDSIKGDEKEVIEIRHQKQTKTRTRKILLTRVQSPFTNLTTQSRFPAKSNSGKK